MDGVTQIDVVSSSRDSTIFENSKKKALCEVEEIKEPYSSWGKVIEHEGGKICRRLSLQHHSGNLQMFWKFGLDLKSIGF